MGLGNAAACARARSARAARRPLWQLHHELERLVASGRSPYERAARHGVPAVASLLSPHIPFTLAGLAKTLCRTVVAGAAGQLGRSPPAPKADRIMAGSRRDPP